MNTILIGMMKVNFLKRLESSVHSFKITLERTLTKIEELEARIRRFQEYRAENPELDPAEMEIDADDDEELQSSVRGGQEPRNSRWHTLISSGGWRICSGIENS